MFAMLGTISWPAARSRWISPPPARLGRAYWVSIWPELLSPYIQGDTSVTSWRCASTAVVPWLMFQYGMDATTSVCRGAPPLKSPSSSPTRTAPARTTASHAAPANLCRGRPGTVPCAPRRPGPPAVRALAAGVPCFTSLASSQPAAAAAGRRASSSSITAWMISSRLRVARNPTRSPARVQSGTRRCMSS